MNVSLAYRLMLAAAITTAAGLLRADDDVLYWMVGSAATVDGTAVSTFFSDYAAESGSDAFAARVRVTGGDITEDTFLQIYTEDGSELFDGEFGMDFDAGGETGCWGAGVPDGIVSPSGVYAGTPEYAFVIELGNIVGDEWTTVAQSASATYSSLANYMAPKFSVDTPIATPWSPTSFTAVPEPSCGMLLTMGLALLALRRGRGGDGRDAG